jgi:carboxyl-terminal processing protease
VPIPYPNFAFNVLGIVNVLRVLICKLFGHNLGTRIPLSVGMNAGVAHPLYMQQSMYTMGSPNVFMWKLPAARQTSLAMSNGGNAPMTPALIPSISTTFINRRGPASTAEALLPRWDEGPALTVATPEACVVLAVRTFSSAITSDVFTALEAHPAREQLVLDLRGCPGGDALAALELAEEFLDRGAELGGLRTGELEPAVRYARRARAYDERLVILVDGTTASAAELFAGCLQHHRRALLVGQRTYGKGRVLEAGGDSSERAAEMLLPGGRSLEGAPLEPDVSAPEGEDVLRLAIQLAMGRERV